MAKRTPDRHGNITVPVTLEVTLPVADWIANFGCETEEVYEDVQVYVAGIVREQLRSAVTSAAVVQ